MSGDIAEWDPLGKSMNRCSVTAGNVMLVLLLPCSISFARYVDIYGPPGSGRFGETVTVLPNGNIVVTDPSGPTSSIGAVYLYSPNGTLISTLTGSSQDDRVGYGGITVLSNGNFVVSSPLWNSDTAGAAGAVTLVDGAVGLGPSAVVSVDNSLVGSTANDHVGGYVVPLVNGNFVVGSLDWQKAPGVPVGAATWSSGTSGITGAISSQNSLIGSTINDEVGSIYALTNGNYVVAAPYWDNGSVVNAGAVTWGDGAAGVKGAISSSNSLVSETDYDLIGTLVTPLSNGNFVVASPNWDHAETPDVGAVTWVDGTISTNGYVSTSNSLVGVQATDLVGTSVTALTNGNYVVASPHWNNAAVAGAGAVTWASGTGPTSTTVSTANSLVGTHEFDLAGSNGVTALTNGNYVVASPHWNSDSVSQVGAATFRLGSGSAAGIVSGANSLIGSTANDAIALGGSGIVALANGNYVVSSTYWSNGGNALAGAATWGSGTSGVSGAVSASNSLIGSAMNDFVGSVVTALANGNYVVSSPGWDSGEILDVGAVTWCDGATGRVGLVNAQNSLVGTTIGDVVGFLQSIALSNGNFLAVSPHWSGTNPNVGAITWINGATGLVGTVSAANSLVGAATADEIGSFSVQAFANGRFAAYSEYPKQNNGALTFGRGDGPISGTISGNNTVFGGSPSYGGDMQVAYDAVGDQIIVGRPVENVVTLFSLPPDDEIFFSGYER